MTLAEGAAMVVKDIVSSHFVSVDADDTISSLLGKLRLLDEISAVVFSGKKLIGMADKRKFLRSRMDSASMKVKKIATKVPVLSLGNSESEAARLLEASDMRSLPVVQNDKVVGVVHSRDVLKSLRSSLQKWRISDISTSKLFSLDEDEWTSKAISKFKKMGFDHIPVVDKKGNMIGIISTTDLLERYFAHPMKRGFGMALRGAASHPAKEFDFSHLPIKNEMSLLVHTISQTDPVSKAIDLMVAEHMASLVIVNGKKPVGIVTIKDVLLALKSLELAKGPAKKASKR